MHIVTTAQTAIDSLRRRSPRRRRDHTQRIPKVRPERIPDLLAEAGFSLSHFEPAPSAERRACHQLVVGGRTKNQITQNPIAASTTTGHSGTKNTTDDPVLLSKVTAHFCPQC